MSERMQSNDTILEDLGLAERSARRRSTPEHVDVDMNSPKNSPLKGRDGLVKFAGNGEAAYLHDRLGEHATKLAELSTLVGGHSDKLDDHANLIEENEELATINGNEIFSFQNTTDAIVGRLEDASLDHSRRIDGLTEKLAKSYDDWKKEQETSNARVNDRLTNLEAKVFRDLFGETTHKFSKMGV
ncbi:hypothetical protein NM208_g16443 [Fusarium decemcellulare]|uniref:Uncharacterized protein n=1 Tax=Fusarium decemcellulare TaxID=57161 RepID=A0ACC1RCR3_9HYPO|nr:hypothetical protein NM208_g16443 [Fusarium decemcellulare]